jgi:pimeloyl-ACP methyl ester carboxylesterase
MTAGTRPPDTRYVKTADGIHIAYQVVGDGPVDLVFVPGLVNHLDFMWSDRRAARFFDGLAAFSRLILFDKRGSGLSDRDVGAATLEERIEDVRAVMAAVGSDRATLFGYSEGGPMSMVFAATYPERTTGLVLAETFAKYLADADHPEGLDVGTFEAIRRTADTAWGTGEALQFFAPSLIDVPEALTGMAAWERAAGSPSAVLAILDLVSKVDVREILPSLRVPTLVVQRSRDPVTGPAQGRYLASHIAGAKYFEQDSDSHILWLDDADALVAEVEEFLVGARTPSDIDRVLATILFTDIVGSTDHAARQGDRAWREVLGSHDTLTRSEIDRHRGRLIKSTGDGVLATFDGPGRAIRCGTAIRDAVRTLGIEVRTGIHTGEIEVIGDDIGGIAVHIAARVMAHAAPHDVLVSSSVPPLVAGSGFSFVDRGEHELKGVPGAWRLFAVDRSAVAT